MVKKYITQAGRLRWVKIKLDNDKESKTRSKKKNPTRKEVAEVNERMSEKKASMWLCNNFHDGDLHMTLTFENDVTPEEAEKAVNNWLSRVRYWAKKLELEFKWFLVTEYRGKRPHHHVVINRECAEIAEEKWTAGYVFKKYLYGNGDYRRLAAYLIKESSKGFRSEDSISGQRYRHSSNLVLPEVREKEVGARAIFSEPEPEKGWYIDRDTVYKGTNPYTGAPYLEYVEKSLEESPKKYRGKKSTYRERLYKLPEIDEEQMSLLRLFGKDENEIKQHS